MFSVGVFLSPPQLNFIPQNQIVKPFLFFNKTHLSLFCNVAEIRTGLCASASRIQTKGILEVDIFDDDGDDDVYEEFEDYDDEEELIVPLKNMKSWLEKKPRGFGEGKVYDTSIEDQLFDEMERSRMAQLANLNKLKNNPEEPNSKKQLLLKTQKESEDVPNGIRVRLANLPKKKNIHRDLQHAFKGVPGIIKIVPAVSGNKKTREPICKGIAFVYFKSQDQANRFVEMFSKEKIAFGKVEKQIKYEIVNSSSLDTQESIDTRIRVPQLAVLNSEKSPVLESSYMANDSMDSREETFSGKYTGGEDKENGEIVIATWEDRKESLEDLISSLPSNEQDMMIHGNEKKIRESKISISANESSSNKKQDKSKGKGKGKGKKMVDIKKRKVSIPGSANRLKGKEKNVLTDVFSKYGGQKGQVAVKEQT